jgi:hypothetical protein
VTTCRDAYGEIMQRVKVTFSEVNQDQGVVDAVVADVVDAVVADVVDAIEVADDVVDSINDAVAPNQTKGAGGGDSSSPSERLEPVIQRRASLWDRNREKNGSDAAVSEGACAVS